MEEESMGEVESITSEDELFGPEAQSSGNGAGSLLNVSRSEQSKSPSDELDKGTEHYVEKNGFSILVPPATRRWEYQIYEQPLVEIILHEYSDDDGISYFVRFSDGTEELVSYDDLADMDGGDDAITHVNTYGFPEDDSDETEDVPARATRRAGRNSHSTITDIIDGSDDEIVSRRHHRVRKLGPARTTLKGRATLRPLKRKFKHSDDDDTESTDDEAFAGRKRQRTTHIGSRSTRAAAQKRINYSDAVPLHSSSDEEANEMTFERPKSRRGKAGTQLVLLPLGRSQSNSRRRSGRNAQFSKSLRELHEDDIPERSATTNVIKFTGAKEHFIQLLPEDAFRRNHCETCDVCYEVGDNEERGRLVYCQGCTLSYHHKCLGYRSTRDHLVTKVGHENFVLQCRRCVNCAQLKDSTAPDQARCWACKEVGLACRPFRARKTVKQEQKEREDNAGEDPVTPVADDLINNLGNMLFRCMTCYRACHVHHLERRVEDVFTEAPGFDDQQTIEQRLHEYAKDWRCKLCVEAPADVDGFVAWRPNEVKEVREGTAVDDMKEDAKEYLVKWKKLPHSKITWMPGAWVWGVTTPAMRKAFARKDSEANLLRFTTEDAVPEEYMRVDIVFDIEYSNVVKFSTLDVDLKRIKEINKALVKFKGLGYEDAVWIESPQLHEEERYKDFEDAYYDWVMGRHIALPSAKNLSSHVSRIRGKNFEANYALKEQPDNLTGGKLMKYQLEGINWLYYQWFRQQNAILADEMGLGKTIQIIGFLATLKQEHGCWPFLVVVPNSTCPNWRREIKHWAPTLRVVTYFGSAEARRLASKYELFPAGHRDLRCHVVVTSYDAAQDAEFRAVFRGIRWAGLIVDEGQRLKNDKSILYSSLNALKAPFKVLLTGTPLQNNARELFNLLQFLDPSKDAEAMDERYAELDAEKLKELHEKLKPIFLRRTKAQVLTFLPPMAQIIVPVSLSTLQKKLYRSILAKNPELIKSIIGAKKLLKQTERANLNNILMQLRKCLCHPFVYSKSIEERSRDPIVSHRNLVDASSKLQLLELMLPMLQDRGHRVLIFSQFLDMLDIIEDFLDGLGLLHHRLDGSMSALEKQRRIDDFNAPDSNLFAFLLSTRAGGVGINLATADTVIILDPDFNPHQDIQALSRAHRIGQDRKVLVFQLTTRSTAEEKIMQIGKKKMMLDHVLIEQMDAADDAGVDLESILRHGTEAIFTDDDTQDIKYDSASIDKLLDRTQIENTKADEDKSAESQFSFAKVWVNDKGTLEDGMEDALDVDPDPSLWDKILREREKEAIEEKAMREQEFGRGRRKRENVDYAKETVDDLGADGSPIVKRTARRLPGSESDTDFQASDHESEDADMPDEDSGDIARELEAPGKQRASNSRVAAASNARGFKRAEMPLLTPRSAMLPNGRSASVGSDDGKYFPCIACHEKHDSGYCPLKVAGIEHCNLCGLAHYGVARTCPHLNSVTQLRAMVEAIKQSPESQELKDLAKKRIVGIIGDLNQRKRKRHQAHQVPAQPLMNSGGTSGEQLIGQGLNSFKVPVPGNPQWSPSYLSNGATVRPLDHKSLSAEPPAA